jgi:hypothetical protein
MIRLRRSKRKLLREKTYQPSQVMKKSLRTIAVHRAMTNPSPRKERYH